MMHPHTITTRFAGRRGWVVVVALLCTSPRLGNYVILTQFPPRGALSTLSRTFHLCAVLCSSSEILIASPIFCSFCSHKSAQCITRVELEGRGRVKVEGGPGWERECTRVGVGPILHSLQFPTSIKDSPTFEGSMGEGW